MLNSLVDFIFKFIKIISGKRHPNHVHIIEPIRKQDCTVVTIPTLFPSMSPIDLPQSFLRSLDRLYMPCKMLYTLRRTAVC